MALDGIVINALANEFKDALMGGKIDKIYQPERDELIMTIRCYKETYKLLLCAHPSFPRVHFTNIQKENPASPPMFCMLLRKHLCGGKIKDIYQHEFERIIKFEIEAYDELGDLSLKTLIIEIMGKHSNIILVNKDGRIIDSIFHVDLTISSIRQVLPGLEYVTPPSQGKSNPLLLSYDILKNSLDDSTETELPSLIMQKYMGISPLVSREVVYRAFGRCDVLASEAVFDKLYEAFARLMDDVKNKNFQPSFLINKDTKSLIDFSAVHISQYQQMVVIEPCASTTCARVNEMLENFYIKKAANESIKQKSADLLKFLNTNLERCLKKLQIQEETIEKTKKRDRYKIKGDLIISNIHAIQRGDKSIKVQNFYSEDLEEIEIVLKENLTPSQNAQRYYARYNKEKTAEEQSAKQKQLNLAEIDYLESVKDAILKAETGSDISQIQGELIEQGYLKNKGRIKKNAKVKPATPMHFKSSDGYDIYVGKNNKQNDYVTLKLGYPTDIWFHTKNIHGSHALVKTNDAMSVPENTYKEAATLAAYYSKGRSGENVPVDYTEVRNVKKPSGAKPGMVIYDRYSTMYVTPAEDIVNAIKKQ